jgi:hypothetical protein
MLPGISLTPNGSHFLLDREIINRTTKRAQIRLLTARLRYSQASVEDVNYRAAPFRQSPLPAARHLPLDCGQTQSSG